MLGDDYITLRGLHARCRIDFCVCRSLPYPRDQATRLSGDTHVGVR